MSSVNGRGTQHVTGTVSNEATSDVGRGRLITFLYLQKDDM